MEMVTAVTAVAIGVCAIGVSLYETTLVRQQLKGSAWPSLQAGFSYSSEGFRYVVVNSGVGPARILRTEVTVDGEAVASWQEFFERLELDVSAFGTSYVGRRVLAPGETVEPLFFLDQAQPGDQLIQLNDRIELSFCYCSIYDDCWVTTTQSDESVPVGACSKDEDRRFRN